MWTAIQNIRDDHQFRIDPKNACSVKVACELICIMLWASYILFSVFICPSSLFKKMCVMPVFKIYLSIHHFLSPAFLPVHFGHGEQRLSELRPRQRWPFVRAGRLLCWDQEQRARHVPRHSLLQRKTHCMSRNSVFSQGRYIASLNLVQFASFCTKHFEELSREKRLQFECIIQTLSTI